MPATKVIKPKPVEAKTNPVRAAAGAQRQPKAVRKGRASSWCPQRDRCERDAAAAAAAAGAQGAAPRRSRERRARSTSAARKPAARRPRARGAVPREESTACPEQPGPRGARAEAGHRAFTVFPPNPGKRREMQRKAEAELAALEELRLSRAMAYVSISPSSVGGCMSLEEVRLKQQQEMMQAKRKHKPVGQLLNI